MKNSELREGFFQECEDLMEALADGLALLESGQGSGETLNAIFRAVHSIKGGAAAFGLQALVDFAHTFENVLDAARSGRMMLEEGALGPCLRASDRLSDLVAAARRGEDAADPDAGALAAELGALLGTPSSTSPSETRPDFIPIGFALDLPGLPDLATLSHPSAGEASRYRIRLVPHRELYSSGNDPALLFRALEELGDLEVALDSARLPPLAEMAWEESYLAWTLRLTTTEPEARLHELFEFVTGSCELDIVPDGTRDSVAEAPPLASMVQPPLLPQPAPGRIGSAAGPTAEAHAAARATIRVDLERVDRLINLVGELVINQAMLTQSIDEANLPPQNGVEAAMAQLRQLSSELQERVMAIRAQPVKPLFQRMSRIVREAAHASGKQARLVAHGETTEVDKTVVERLADPLTHMIRNAIDHGLEPQEARRAAGKPPEGTIELRAAHRSGRVILELHDDGAGIDRHRVREIAIARGLVPEDKELAEEEIDNLLFMPGFSTKSEVSALSGRGVGMDVVKSEIQRLGGRVGVASTPGAGTTVSISLPLTLAVLEGMVVEVAGETLVVPTTALQETLKAAGADIERIGANGWFLSIRGGFVPIIDLGARLGFTGADADIGGSILLLVETGTGSRAALAVDRVLDQREVVIKGLENNYGHVPGIAAATILGDGRIALIIDVDEATTVPPDRLPGMYPAGATEHFLAVGV